MKQMALFQYHCAGQYDNPLNKTNSTSLNSSTPYLMWQVHPNGNAYVNCVWQKNYIIKVFLKRKRNALLCFNVEYNKGNWYKIYK